MGFVYIDLVVVLVGKFGDGGQVGDGVFYVEYCVYDDDLVVFFGVVQYLCQVVYVVVLV